MKKNSKIKLDKNETKFSVLRLDENEKERLEELSRKIGMSMNQIIVFSAISALKLEIEPVEKPEASVQIRLPSEIHTKLQELADKTNRPMTELIKLGLTSAFGKLD